MPVGGVPYDWVKDMKAAMQSNAALFSARRMAKEHTASSVSKVFKELLKRG